MAEVNGRYEELGGELKNRRGHQEASLELRQKASQGTEELSRWLGDRENSLHLGQTTTSPSKPELVRAQAQENKVSVWTRVKPQSILGCIMSLLVGQQCYIGKSVLSPPS